MSDNIKTQEFIKRAKEVHGDKYDYSLVDYKNCDINIIIICNIHGQYMKRPMDHLYGSGCKICNKIFKRQTQFKINFIEKAKQVHGDKYDYSQIDYIDITTKVTIICYIHGQFNQTPSAHLQDHGCQKCGIKKCTDQLFNTTEQFIEEAKKIYGDKYDYSLVEYIRSNERVKIICKIHGVFEQTPSGHKNGGCLRCAIINTSDTRKKTKEQFIVEANNIHKNKYDYSLVNYINSNTKVIIICIIHGQFEKIPNEHLHGSGCNLCNKKTIDTNLLTNNFIEKAQKIHGNKYDYSLVDYVNNTTNIIIICKIHGKFEQKPSVHLMNCGCRLCSLAYVSNKFTLSNDHFIKKAKETHGDKYDYSLVKYISARDPVQIICLEHGIFKQVPYVHYRAGCPTCGLIKNGLGRRKTNDQFIEDAKEIHGDKYDYSLVNYQGDTSKIEIICQTHGSFKQTAGGHLQGHGCIRCGRGNVSKKQLEWLNYIAKRDNIYIQHAMNDGEFRVGKYKIDGYCKETNTCYEFLGDLWHGNPRIYKHFDKNPVNKRYYGDLYISTLEKQVYIMNQGYLYESIWEDEWDTIVKNNQQQ